MSRPRGHDSRDMDALAELVADGAGIAQAGHQIGLTRLEAENVWRRIKHRLGWQVA